MNKIVRFSLIAMFLMSVPMFAHAQISGCVDSPENPTAILMVVGAAAAGFPALRAKFRRNRQK